jgi:electron transport complex protein RnfG
MNKTRKQILVTGALLMLFGVIGSLMVGVIHIATAKQVAENERQALLTKLNQILPAERYDNDLIGNSISLDADERLGTTESSTAWIATKNGELSAVIFQIVAPDGYSGAIRMLVGVNADGTLSGVRVISHRETPGLGDLIDIARSKWILGFDGKSLQNPDENNWKVKRDGGVFDQFTGATITPRAVVKAVHLCLIYFDRHRDEFLGKHHQENEADHE